MTRTTSTKQLVANVLVGFVAIEHFAFMVLEMFFWDHPVGRKIFNMSDAFSAASAALAANQGLSNGILAAGLAWGLWKGNKDFKVFFLIAVVIAGLFGAATAKLSLLGTQAAPALIALVLVYLAAREQTAEVSTAVPA